MQIFDLTHPLSPDTPVYPGVDPPVFVTGFTIEEHGFTQKKITMFTHTGTHVDAPSHILPNGKTLDLIPVEKFCGPAVVLDLTKLGRSVIEQEDLAPFEAEIAQNEFVILLTGWNRLWGKSEFFKNFPVPSLEAAKWLTGFGLKGLGTDAISVDTADSTDFPVHQILLGQEMVIIENLTNLDNLVGKPFFLSVLPLPIETASGCPVRAVAFTDWR